MDNDYKEIREVEEEEDKEKNEQPNWEWASTIAEGNPPSARGGHSATLIGKSIVIFGGHYYKNKVEGFCYLNDTHFLDFELSKWLKPTITGKIPPPRYGHSSIFAGGIIIVFGGKGPKDTVYNDLYTFDPDQKRNSWLVANETGESPAPRFNHIAQLWNKKMYIFGGWNGKDFFNDTLVYDLEKMIWNKIETFGTPQPRMGHASCVVGSHLIIQGGFYFDNDQYKKNINNYGSYLKSCYFNDIKVLDLENNTWAQLKTSGQPPQPRFGHTISFINSELIIFGGWSCNSGRKFNAMVNSSQNEYSEDEVYLYSLNTNNTTWEKTKYSEQIPSNRYGHTATILRQNIIFFGGWEFGKALNDINILLSK